MALTIGSSFLSIFLKSDQFLAIILISEIVIILAVFSVLAFIAWPRLKNHESFKAGGPAGFFSTFWGLSIAILLLTLIFFLPEIDKPMAILDALSGAVFGWFLGMYLSPHSEAERNAFTGYKSALAGLLSGVVLTKAQTLLSQKYSDAKDIHLKDAQYFLIFWVAVGVCAATIYNARAYGEGTESKTINNQAAVPGTGTGSAPQTANNDPQKH
jgi:hypothetical protein